MKSLLVFIPKGFRYEKPGYMYGKVISNTETGVKKFYIIGIRRASFEVIKSSTDIIGYYSGTETLNGIIDKKCCDWINVRMCVIEILKDKSYDYYLRTVIANSKRVSLQMCHTVLIIYDQLALQRTELFADRTSSGNHFYELMTIVQNQDNSRRNTQTCRIKDWLTYYMLLIFHPLFIVARITNDLLPVLKYSSLGLHIHEWIENMKWMVINVIENKRFTLKTANYALALIIDILLGICALQLMLYVIEDTPPSEILLSNAEKVVKFLKNLINWLMGAPAGLKLNYAFNNMLGNFFLYHIHLWWTFLIFMKVVMDFAFEVLLLFGRLGITFQISIAADLLALVSFHTYCIYVYAARLFNLQLRGLTALFRLFLGKKKNPLRERVDSCQYQPDQLFVGTLLFTILLFLMPTTWVYYTVFTTLRLVMIGLGGFLTRLKFYIQVIPMYTFIVWLLHSYKVCSVVDIQVHSRQIERPVTIAMSLIAASWSETWKKCTLDTIVSHPSIEWGKIFNNIIWGNLLYPL